MDAETLYGVMESQGRTALEEARQRARESCPENVSEICLGRDCPTLAGHCQRLPTK